MGRCNRCTLVLILSMLIGGCSGREESRAKKFLGTYDEPVELAGQVLDLEAPPERVAWALLTTLREDVRAGGDKQAREQVWRKQCRLAHHELIRSRSAKIIKQRRVQPDEFVFDVITGWAPIVAYYTRFFDSDFDSAAARMQTTDNKLGGIGPDKNAVDIKDVDYVLPAASRGGPSGLQIGVTIRVSLARTGGGFWRVFLVEYRRSPDLLRLQDEE